MMSAKQKIFLIIVLGAISASMSCSHFSMDKYVSRDFEKFKKETQCRTIAVMPLLVVSPRATTTELFEIGRELWLRRQTKGMVLSAGEVKPAESKVVAVLKKMTESVKLIEPDDVQDALKNADATTEEELFKAVAQRTGADAVLSFVVRGFNSTQGGWGRESEGSALVTVMCYDKKGLILWTLSTSYGYKISGFSAAPTISDYMKTYMEQAEAPLREMIESTISKRKQQEI